MVIHIKSPFINTAWQECCKKLLKNGEEDVPQGFFRHSAALIEIEGLTSNYFDEKFPMSDDDIQAINEYLVTGGNEENVVHEWTKIYRQRLFGQFNQIDSVISYLRQQPSGKRAQASIWRPEDINASIAPCLQILWFQIKAGKLEMHVHMRAVDCFGKLLMNINEFAAVQRYVAQQLNVPIGKYLQFIDSLHFNTADVEKVKSLFA